MKQRFARARIRSAALSAALPCLAVASLLLGAPAARADQQAAERTDTVVLGADVSWPQCGGTLPDNAAFAVVGVNGGTPRTGNPCLGMQLAWAAHPSPASVRVSPALYVNTDLSGRDWPASNLHAGSRVDNPYGECDGGMSAACAYAYGWVNAYDDVNLRNVPEPSHHWWWLDVEIENAWSADRALNRAVLEGMTDYFTGIGAQVGIYSTGYQWGQIVGAVPQTSNLYRLPGWLGGALDTDTARAACSAAPLTGGGHVAMVQFIAGDFDANYPCVPAHGEPEIYQLPFF